MYSCVGFAHTEWKRIRKLSNDIGWEIYYYRPQGKVMLSEAFVCPPWEGREIPSSGQRPDRTNTPLLLTETSLPPFGQRSPPPRTETTFGQRPPLNPCPPPPEQRDPTRYWHLVAATAAVGTHPAGMHYYQNCFLRKFRKKKSTSPLVM